jgi:hypothetical protein
MSYDDHSYCEQCGLHSLDCYCFSHSGPEDWEMALVCLEHDTTLPIKRGCAAAMADRGIRVRAFARVEGG